MFYLTGTQSITFLNSFVLYTVHSVSPLNLRFEQNGRRNSGPGIPVDFTRDGCMCPPITFISGSMRRRGMSIKGVPGSALPVSRTLHANRGMPPCIGNGQHSINSPPSPPCTGNDANTSIDSSFPFLKISITIIYNNR